MSSILTPSIISVVREEKEKETLELKVGNLGLMSYEPEHGIFALCEED